MSELEFEDYQSKPVRVRAAKAEETQTVVTIHGVRTVVKGDYVVELTGHKVVTNEESGEPEEVEYCVGTDIVVAADFELIYKRAPKRKLPGDE